MNIHVKLGTEAFMIRIMHAVLNPYYLWTLESKWLGGNSRSSPSECPFYWGRGWPRTAGTMGMWWWSWTELYSPPYDSEWVKEQRSVLVFIPLSDSSMFKFQTAHQHSTAELLIDEWVVWISRRGRKISYGKGMKLWRNWPRCRTRPGLDRIRSEPLGR